MVFLFVTLKATASNFDWTEGRVLLAMAAWVFGGGAGEDLLKSRLRKWLNDGERNPYAGDD
jgi:hypothetical protein